MPRREPPEPRPVSDLVAALGVACSEELMERALTHRSYAYEHGGLPTNERLEFLGDAVLGLVVTNALYRRFPDLPEGQLAKLRASIVNMRALAGVARTIGGEPDVLSDVSADVSEEPGPDDLLPSGLGAYIHLGRGEQTTGGYDKPSILADTLEAVIGAVYVEGGISAASDLVLGLFEPLLRGRGPQSGLDWKTALQESAAARGLGPPEYLVEESGPDHAKRFVAVAVVGGRRLGDGVGSSKKEAEQQAAEGALGVLEAEDQQRGATAP